MPPTWGSRSRRRAGDGGEREAERWKSRLQRGCCPFFFLFFFIFFWRVVIAVVILVIVGCIGPGNPHGFHLDDDDDDDD